MDQEQYGCSYYNLIFIIILSTNIFLYKLDCWEVLDVCWKRGCWYSRALNLDALAEFVCWHTWVRFIVFSFQPPFSTGEKHKSAPTLPSVSGSQPTIWWISNLAQFTQLEYEVQYHSLEYFCWKRSESSNQELQKHQLIFSAFGNKSFVLNGGKVQKSYSVIVGKKSIRALKSRPLFSRHFDQSIIQCISRAANQTMATKVH